MKRSRPDDNWLIVELDAPWQVLGWPVLGPHRGQASRIAWHRVRNEELGPEVDALALTAERAAARGLAEEVVLLTSASLERAEHHSLGPARVLATVGLSNGLRVERAGPAQAGWGTINLLVAVDAPLSEPAALELLTIATQARTAAVMESGAITSDGRPPTGTGTDCIVLAWPRVGEVRWAGLHTEVGQSVGGAVHAAVAAGCASWLAKVASRGPSALYPDRPRSL